MDKCLVMVITMIIVLLITNIIMLNNYAKSNSDLMRHIENIVLRIIKLEDKVNNDRPSRLHDM
jgi:hypothetical protein